jgi:3-hydroxyacyl-CoA dehydrogenase/enoyl-CoA hydratase/3-hydroxybutyryl-CoA epimerase
MAKKNVLKKTKGNYPAPLEAIKVLLHGVRTTRRFSFDNEKQTFIKLARSQEADNLLRIFFLQEKSKKLSIPNVVSGPLKHAVVLGAGTMGAGIAHWLSLKGVDVLLKDVKEDLVAAGLKKIGNLYVAGVLKHKIDRPTARDGLARISTSTQTNNLHNKDIVIEAIVEKLSVKQNVLAQLEEQVSDDCIIASNTSALSITEMAKSLERPDRFIGIHFFNPVHQMKLVEIVRGEKTSDVTVQYAIKFVQSIGKLPVVVKDSPGFVVNRILIPYLVKAVELTYDYPPAFIDAAMVDFGMPMGPFRLMDEIGLDVCTHVAWDICDRLNIDCSGMVMLEEKIKAGHLGKKTGRGFYNYKDKKKEKDYATRETKLAIMSILSKVMTDEAVKVIEEGVIDDPDMLDLAMIMGTGWAPFRGGPLKHIKYERKDNN